VFVLDTLLIGGLKFVLNRIAQAVDAQLNDVEAIREELLAAQMQLELGELSETEFAEIERALLDRLRAVREAAEADVTADGPVRITGVDVSVAGDADDEGGRPAR
jgi:hypothetical protein